MLKRIICGWLIGALFLSLSPLPVAGQGGTPGENNVAQLRVVNPGTEVARINTAAWVPVKVESLVGVGDGVRTLERGRAQIIFLDGVLVIDLSESSELTIDAFTGDGANFNVRAIIRRGFASFRTLRTLSDSGTERFQLSTPGLTILARQGSGTIRVESSGRSALLLPTGGQAEVQAGDPKAAPVTITEGQGVRAEVNGPLSDVVTVNSFPRLDSALDGCPSTIQLTDDVRVNVRLGASRDFPRIGGLGDDTDIQAMGVVASGGWYRVKFKGGFGWIEVRALPLNRSCAGLRIFPDNAGPEDVALYSDLTEQAELTATPTN